MAEIFYTILTNAGKAKIANSTALGTKVNFTTLKVGDSNGTYYNPTEAQEDLVHTVWQGNINSIRTDEENPNWLITEVAIPPSAGGFTVREVGLFDDEGYMLAVGKYPETYKPQMADGSTKDITIRTIFEVSNTASVTLKIDPSTTLATQKDIQELRNQIQNISIPVTKVNEKTGNVVLKASDIKTDEGTTLEEVKGEVDTHLAEDATESQKGHIQLATAAEVTTGTNTTKAVTPKNLKTELDKKLNITDYNPHDADNGRYQADFGLEDAVLSGCFLNSANQVTLSLPETIKDNSSLKTGSMTIYNGISIGQKMDVAATATITKINYIEAYVSKNSSPTSNLIMYLYDDTSKTLLTTITKSSGDITDQAYNRFTPTSPIDFTPGHVLLICFSAPTATTTSNYNIGDMVTGTLANESEIKNTDNWTSFIYDSTTYAARDLALKISCDSNFVTGTVTKTVTPSDLKKWGNIKVTVTNINANNSATVTVKSSADVQLKAPVTLVNGDNYIDIADINSSTYASLKVVFMLSRNSTSDTSPTISDVSITWEGGLEVIQPTKPMNLDAATGTMVQNQYFTVLNITNGKGKLFRFSATSPASTTRIKIKFTVDGSEYVLQNTINSYVRGIATRYTSADTYAGDRIFDWIGEFYFKNSLKIEIINTFDTTPIVCAIDYALV